MSIRGRDAVTGNKWPPEPDILRVPAPERAFYSAEGRAAMEAEEGKRVRVGFVQRVEREPLLWQDEGDTN